MKLLKKYFRKKPEILMAFVFGSQTKGSQIRESDWDIGVYFKPKGYLELESNVEEYEKNRDERRNIERWVENIVMASINIAQAFLASEKRRMSQSYSNILKLFVAIHINENSASKFAEFAKLRNIVTHEYLDITWARIKNFISKVEKLYPKFIEKVEKLLKNKTLKIKLCQIILQNNFGPCMKSCLKIYRRRFFLRKQLRQFMISAPAMVW